MTQRDDAAAIDLQRSSEDDERPSGIRPISAMCCADDASHEESLLVNSGASETREEQADQTVERELVEPAVREAVEPAVDDATRGVRPTLMGLAPIDPEGASEGPCEVEDEEAEPRGRPGAAALMAADDIADAGSETRDEQGSLAAGEEGMLAAREDEDDLCAPLAGRGEAPEDEDDAWEGAALASHADDAALAQPASASNNASVQTSTAGTWVGPVMSLAEPARLPDDADPEWLDLSTRWLIATGPQSDEELCDDSEVTNELHWADHLVAGARPRAQMQSSAPQPPQLPQLPQFPQLPQLPQAPPTAAEPARRVTVAYGRPSEVPAAARAGATPAALDPQAARQWAEPPRRHATLAGISPLPEDRSTWSPAPDVHAPAEGFAADPLRAGRAHPEPQRWSHERNERDEPSYRASHRPQAPRQSWAPSNGAAAVGALPPWAAMSMYAPQPAAAAPQAYAAWNAPHLAPQPLAAPPHFAMPQPLYATGTYPAAERRPSQRIEYTPARNGHSSTGRREHARSSQQDAGEVTLEQWKNLANSWMGAVGKLAIAAMALHYSGLAVPLLGQFGYTPASASPAATQAQGSDELAVRTAAPTSASLAAASVIADPARAAFAPARSDANVRRLERDNAAAASEHDTASHWRRAGSKREGGFGREPGGSSESSSSARRRSPKSAHGHKSAASRPVHAREQEEAPAAANEQQVEQRADTSPTTEQLMAAATTGAEEPAAEAMLRINSRPWSQVFVDGTLVGNTPKIDLRVSAGVHRVRLVNPELALSKTVQLNAPAGETISLVEQLEE